MEEPGVQGVAVLYDRPIIHDGRIVMFESGCFGDTVSDGAKALLFGHDDRDVIGTTADGLEFAGHTEALVYRLPLSANRRRSQVERGIDDGSRGCASVGVVFRQTRDTEIAGVPVTIIAKADLREVSLVERGACTGTSASIVDLAKQPRLLWAAAKDIKFKMDQLASNSATGTHHLLARLERIGRMVGTPAR